jgi:predicted SprT family Zn-dependent metalloprotease
MFSRVCKYKISSLTIDPDPYNDISVIKQSSNRKEAMLNLNFNQNRSNSRYMKMVEQILQESINRGKFVDELKIVKENVTVSDSNRMTRAAGLARIGRFNGQVRLNTMELKLSVKLMERCSDEEKRETIIHELAHLVDFVIRGSSNHDHNWKAISIALGSTGNRCHNIDRSGLKRQNKVTRWELLDRSTGRIIIVSKKSKQRAMTMSRYELRARLVMRGKEVIERHPAQLGQTLTAAFNSEFNFG